MRYSRNIDWWKNYEWLYEQYITLDRRTVDIAEELGCKQCTVQDWLKRFGIHKQITKHYVAPKNQYEQYDYLYEQHIILGKSMAQIARENGVSSDTIRYNLDKNNIPIHRTVQRTKLTEQQIDDAVDMYVNQKVSANQIAKQFGVGRGNLVKCLKKRGVDIRGLSDAQLTLAGKDVPEEFYSAELLSDMHWNKNMSCVEMGEYFNVCPGTMRRQMHRLGVQTRTNAESKIGLMTGENHPNWKGGITELSLLVREYFHTNIVPIVAKRDNYTCQCCGKQHTILHVHHKTRFAFILDEILSEHKELQPNDESDKQVLYKIIIEDKRFLDTDNLITLCAECHRQLHSTEG